MKLLTSFVVVAAVLGGTCALPAAVLLRDNFDANTGNTTDLNVDIARQTGTKAPINYTMAGGPGLYGHQLQNGNALNQLLVADFGNSTSSLNFNFNGVNSAGGLKISFDLDSVPTLYGGDPGNWGCINLGAAQGDQLVNVNGGQAHFGILFRGTGTIQAFDGGAVVSPNPEPVFTSQPRGTTNHIDLIITDADGNPFDGTGNTVIEVFVNGGPLPVWTFTKVGGYANNYINLQGSFRAHFDNLTIEQLPADRVPVVVNPSFEVDHFPTWPGYVSQNGPITGWNALGGHGINPVAPFGPNDHPFADNGTIPDGSQVAFMQEAGAMRQIISGFTIGAPYQVQYFENSRNCCGGTPSSEVRINGNTIATAHAVPPVGGANPYRQVVSAAFNATGTAMELAIIKGDAAPGDSTLLIDNVRVVALSASPAITVQPQDAVVALGDTFTLAVGASGSAPLSYQWYFGAEPVFNGNAASLSILADFPDVAGNYSVVVSNPSGSVTSRVARVTVLSRVPGLFNTGVDDTGNALGDGAVDGHYQIVVNPDGASPEAFVENSAAFPIVSGPWVANNAGSKWIGPRFDTTGAAGAVGAGGDYTYRTVFDLAGYDPATVIVTGQWATDNGGIDIVVNGRSTGLQNTAQFASFTPFTLNSGFVDGLNVIEFKLNNAAVGYTGLRIDQIRALANPLPDGTRPFIVSQPQGATLAVGQTATFSVRANGSAPISYQWYYGPDPLPGATGPVLTFPIEFPDVAGDYSVEISNGAGSVRSAVATLVVLAEPVILAQPQSLVVAVGDPATFTVSAIGEPPLTYQWLKDGAPIPGAEQASYTIGAVAAGDAGVYTVEIFNFSGTATSQGATLTIAELVPGLFNTGVDDARVGLPSGSVDPHWTLAGSADAGFPGPAAYVLNDVGFPIPPWMANDEISKWIAPQASQGSGNMEGDYVYRTTFSLDGFDPATTVLSGEWSSDNVGGDILVNGVSSGQANTGNFGAWSPFRVTSGFHTGVNTIDFKVNNAPPGVNPTGFRVRNIRAVALVRPNRAPSFVKGADVSVVENSGPQSVPGWATSISAGEGDAGQTLTFIVTADTASLFSAGPAIDAGGTLTFTTAPDAVGTSRVTVVLKDNGGTANGGVDTSAPQTFVITVTPANRPPVARFDVTPLFHAAGLEWLTVVSANGSNACVLADGSASSDPDGDDLAYAWFLDGSVIPAASGVMATICIEVGVHDLTLLVSDPRGANGTETKRLEVITAAEAVDVLIEEVNETDLDRKNKRPFLATLKAAQASFDRGDNTPALNQLGAFQNKVRAQLGRTHPETAAAWIRLAQAIVNAVNAQTAP